MKLIVGLTGQTGAGKSITRRVAEQEGFAVIDCDSVAHSVTSCGSDALKALCKVFSDSILFEDGSLNRKALAAVAFSSKENTELLNKTVLPYIVDKLTRQIKEMPENNIILDAPTLFESGIDEICTVTVAVIADDEIRKNRIILRDNLTIEEAMQRINAGKNSQFYIKNADHIIINNGSSEEFLKNFENLLREILGGNKNG